LLPGAVSLWGCRRARKNFVWEHPLLGDNDLIDGETGPMILAKFEPDSGMIYAANSIFQSVIIKTIRFVLPAGQE